MQADAVLLADEMMLASWHESTERGPRPDQWAPPFSGETVAPSDLLRAAKPVVDRLGADLVATDTSVVLSDAEVRIVARSAASAWQRTQLDALGLAPGYSWRVADVGTNALGLTSMHRSPVQVTGSEHFMDALVGMAMAAAPVKDPRTGQLLGAVSLVCRVTSANSLLLPVARRTAREIEHRLLDGTSSHERILQEHFLRARRHARGPVVVVGERVMLMNGAAARLVGNDDRSLLWDLAEQAIEGGSASPPEFRAPNGLRLIARLEAVRDGGNLAGAVMRLAEHDDEAHGNAERRRRTAPSFRATFGWDSLTETERCLADLVAEGLTNKQAAARLFLSRHTIDSHLRHIYRKLDINSRVDLTRLVTGSRDAPAA